MPEKRHEAIYFEWEREGFARKSARNSTEKFVVESLLIQERSLIEFFRYI
jgi:hypothetical protein